MFLEGFQKRFERLKRRVWRGRPLSGRVVQFHIRTSHLVYPTSTLSEYSICLPNAIGRNIHIHNSIFTPAHD